MSSSGFVALLSGGLDSVVAMAVAAEESKPLLALTFDYGQPASGRERQAASEVASHYQCPHQVIDLPWYSNLLPASFAGGDATIPEPETMDQASAEAVWVPGRNLVMIAIASAWAEKLGAGQLVVGFNAEEAATFPDNCAEFVAAVTQSMEYSSNRRVRLNAPLADLNKVEILRLGWQLKAPLESAWSCYRGGESPCGSCESCQRRGKAFNSL